MRAATQQVGVHGAPGLAVGVGALAVSSSGATLATHGLGSCVAVCTFDPEAGVSGLLHFMLPASRIDAERARQRPDLFADLGVENLLRAVQHAGGRRNRLRAKLIGGASFLATSVSMDVGKRNVLAARKHLWAAGVNVVAEAVGGTQSRTVHLCGTTGVATIRTPGVREVRL